MSENTFKAEVATRNREQALADTFVNLADTLVEDYDVVDLLDQLVGACLKLLDIAAAGLLLDDQKGHLVVMAASSEEAQLLEIFQIQNNEGPCLESVRTGRVVARGHLDQERVRWPSFVPAALEAGFQSVAAIPLRLRTQIIGALNLFNPGPEPIAPDDQRLAQALADVATIGILQQRSIDHGSIVGAQLQLALNSRIAIEQAKGVLAERNTMNMETAFNALRTHARNHNLKLTDVASEVIRGDLDLSFSDGPPPP
jgi:GAF domain-containing protein